MVCTAGRILAWTAIVVAVTLLQPSCGAHFNAARWKRETCRRNQFQCNSGACVEVFQLCDGTKHCDDGSDETADLCKRKICPSQAFTCDYGACVDKVGLCNGINECADGSDEKPGRCGKEPSGPTPDPSSNFKPNDNNNNNNNNSRELCPALVSPSREFECKLNDRNVDCRTPMNPGTEASVKCNLYYTHTNELSVLNIICNSNGKWSQDVTPCVPKCGEPNAKGVPFIAGGIKTNYGEYPWNAGLYRLDDGRYVQVCGGTIISERIIVTAAHCLWDESNSGSVDIKKVKVTVGNYYRDWNNNQDSYLQTPEIERMVPHHRYRGMITNFANDIALIKLRDPIKMTIGARPICMDYTKSYQNTFVPGKTGVVVGWGITDDMKSSDVLHKTTLPYVSFSDCERGVPEQFLAFLTNDKFCAGYRNGTSVCPGDAGAGFATQFRDGKWYLMGVVSLGVPGRHGKLCDVYQYAAFTRVSDHYGFILDNSD